MHGRTFAGHLQWIVFATTVTVVAPAFGQTFANPFATQPPPALQPATPFTTPGLSPAWDPYATPGAVTTPTPALPATPYGAGPYGTPTAPTTPGYPFDDWTQKSIKAIQNVSIRSTWLDSGGANGFGMTNTDLSVSFALPIFANPNLAPLILTPGFNFHMLQGPRLAPPQDLPGIVYDAFAQLSWQPQLTERLGADLAFSMGAYSDFQYVDWSSVRLLGRAVGTWTFSPSLKGALGVVYLDRLDVKILPVFGVIWIPNPDTRYELLFPQPKLAQRITNWGNNEIWGYIGAEYGGGQWSIEHAGGFGRDEFNYNDFRVYVGVESIGPGAKRMYFEVGWAFHREIIWRNFPNSGFNPADTVMLRGGWSF